MSATIVVSEDHGDFMHRRSTCRGGDCRIRMHAGITRALQDPEVKKRFIDDGAEVTPSATPEDFGAQIRAELAKWAKVVKDAGIKVE